MLSSASRNRVAVVLHWNIWSFRYYSIDCVEVMQGGGGGGIYKLKTWDCMEKRRGKKDTYVDPQSDRQPCNYMHQSLYRFFKIRLMYNKFKW